MIFLVCRWLCPNIITSLIRHVLTVLNNDIACVRRENRWFELLYRYNQLSKYVLATRLPMRSSVKPENAISTPTISSLTTQNTDPTTVISLISLPKM